MKTPRLIANLLGAAFGMGALFGPAHSAPVTARLTADNNYSAYVGAADGSGLTQIGADYDWTTAENYSFNANSGDYLYVVAWNRAGTSAQGFQGSVTTGAGTTFSDSTHWEAIRRPSPFIGFNFGSTAPSDALLMAEIFSASWGSTLISTAATTSPWFDVHGGGQADWIWMDTFTPQPGTPTAGGYVLFRTALLETTGQTVPEPSGWALAALALFVTGTRRRTRAGSGVVG